MRVERERERGCDELEMTRVRGHHSSKARERGVGDVVRKFRIVKWE